MHAGYCSERRLRDENTERTQIHGLCETDEDKRSEERRVGKECVST